MATFLEEALEIASLARAWNRPVAPHLVPELSGQLVCCISNGSMVEDVDGDFADLGVLAQDMGPDGDGFRPPPRPGHGIVFDYVALDPWRLFLEPECVS